MLAMLIFRATPENKGKQVDLLNFVMNREPGTQADLAKRLDMSEPAVCYSIKFLRAKMASPTREMAENAQAGKAQEAKACGPPA